MSKTEKISSFFSVQNLRKLSQNEWSMAALLKSHVFLQFKRRIIFKQKKIARSKLRTRRK